MMDDRIEVLFSERMRLIEDKINLENELFFKKQHILDVTSEMDSLLEDNDQIFC